MWALQRLADPDNDKKGDDQSLSNSTKQDTWTINFSFTATRSTNIPQLLQTEKLRLTAFPFDSGFRFEGCAFLSLGGD